MAATIETFGAFYDIQATALRETAAVMPHLKAAPGYYWGGSMTFHRIATI